MRRAEIRRHASWILLLSASLMVVDPLTMRATRGAAAQAPAAPRGEAQNVRFELREEGRVHITYDLISSGGPAVFSIMLDASQDAGATFGLRPQSVTGDVGEKVTSGPGKRIVWDSGKDVERVQIDRFRFRVVATGGSLQAAAKPAAPTGKPAPPATSKPTPAANAPAQEEKKGINPLIWVGGGLGAAALTGVALAAGGGVVDDTGAFTGNTSQPAANRAPVVSQASYDGEGSTGTLLATATSVRFTLAATDPDNDTLTARWDFGDSTTFTGSFSGGTSTVEKTYNNAGSFTASVEISDGRGGVQSYSAGPFVVSTVTGGWRGEFQGFSAFPFSPMNLNQSGSSLNGTAIYDGRAWNIGGTVSNPRRVMIRMTDSQGTYFDFSLTGSSDLRTFTGTETIQGFAWTMTKQ